MVNCKNINCKKGLNITNFLKAMKYFFKRFIQQKLLVIYWMLIYHSLNPNSLLPYLKLGFVEYKRRNYQRAINYYNRALELKTDYRAYQGLADVYLELRDYNNAITFFTRAAELNPKYFRCYHNIGHTYFLMGMYEEAIPYFIKATELNPDFSRSYLSLGKSYFRLSQFDDSVAALKESIRLDPRLLPAYGFAARALSFQNREDEAMELGHAICEQVGWYSCRAHGYRFTKELWFANNIPTFEHYLCELAGKENITALEIGSYQGMSCCWLIDHILTSKTSAIYCVDPQFQLEYDDNILRTRSGDRINKIEAKSQEVLFQFSDSFFDFAYIDGWHVAWQVLLDALMTWPLLKVGGVIIFDDYMKADQTNVGQTVKLGADFFAHLFKRKSEILSFGRQLILKKTTDQVDIDLFDKLSDFLLETYQRETGDHVPLIEAGRKLMLQSKINYREAIQEFRRAIETKPFVAWPDYVSCLEI